MPKAQHGDYFLFFGWVLGAEHCLEVYRLWFIWTPHFSCGGDGRKLLGSELEVQYSGTNSCTSVSEDSVWQCKLWPFPLIYEERRSQQHEETCQGKFLIAWNATLRQQPVISGPPSLSTTWHDFCTSLFFEVLQFPEGQEQLERPDEPCPPQRQLTAVWD